MKIWAAYGRPFLVSSGVLELLMLAGQRAVATGVIFP